jgi:hypothetical protein
LRPINVFATAVLWPRIDPAVDRLLHFTNSGILVGTDPLKSRLDLREKISTTGPAPQAEPYAVHRRYQTRRLAGGGIYRTYRRRSDGDE